MLHQQLLIYIMKRFLAPTDFSDIAGRAMEFAIHLALKCDAEVLFLHAYEVPFSGGAGAGGMKNLDQLHREDAQKRLRKFETKLEETHPTLKYKTFNDASLPVDSIKAFCEEKDFDLVIMGTAGATGIVDFVGSTTSNVIGKVDVPLIAIPASSKNDFPSNVLVASDFKSKNFTQELAPLLELVEYFDATIDFINVKKNASDDKHFDLDGLKAICGSRFGAVHEEQSDDVETGLTNYVENNEVDLLVVISHQKSLWEKLWNKSMSKSLVKHLTIPVMVLPEH